MPGLKAQALGLSQYDQEKKKDGRRKGSINKSWDKVGPLH